MAQPESLETGSAKLQVTQAAIAFVAQRGIPLPSAPQGYQGEMPPSITELTDEQLGDLLNNIAQWLAYLDGQLAVADSERKTSEADLEFRRARIRIAVKSTTEKKMTVSDKDDLTLTDPRILDAQQRSLYCESIYSLMRAARNKAQQDWDTVSRRITQRGQEIERGKRESNVAGVPSAARTFHRRGQ